MTSPISSVVSASFLGCLPETVQDRGRRRALAEADRNQRDDQRRDIGEVVARIGEQSE